MRRQRLKIGFDVARGFEEPQPKRIFERLGWRYRISDRFWRTRFGADPAVAGQQITVKRQSLTIVGVAPRAYIGPRIGVRTDVWAPREKEAVSILARLKPGVTIDQARAEMAVLLTAQGC